MMKNELTVIQQCFTDLFKRYNILLYLVSGCLFAVSCTNVEVKPYNDRLVSGELNITFADTDTFFLDLNGDSKPDYKMGMAYQELSPQDSKICIRCLDDNKVLFDKSLKTGDAELLPLDFGESVNGNFSFANPCLVSPANKYSWAGKGRLYLGLKLEVDNNVQYGWMQVEVDPLGRTLNLYDYGFRLGAFSVKAGEK